jgi:hypothetical protein
MIFLQNFRVLNRIHLSYRTQEVPCEPFPLQNERELNKIHLRLSLRQEVNLLTKSSMWILSNGLQASPMTQIFPTIFPAQCANILLQKSTPHLDYVTVDGHQQGSNTSCSQRNQDGRLYTILLPQLSIGQSKTLKRLQRHQHLVDFRELVIRRRGLSQRNLTHERSRIHRRNRRISFLQSCTA